MVFLGLGIPATMLGHDPDWTHHSSEDKIDKTDASEFRRVGVFASAAGYWMAGAEAQNWDRLKSGEEASRISELSHRIATDVATGPTASAAHRIRMNEFNLQQLVKEFHIQSRHNFEAFPRGADPGVLSGISLPTSIPHRLTVLPLDASAFEGVSAEDGKWLAEQEARFSSDSEGLATKANFGLISFEAVNFMDGHRRTAEIADLISAEYLIDIDQAWVDRLVSILEKQKLVAAGK
jgi:hypothetical protein